MVVVWWWCQQYIHDDVVFCRTNVVTCLSEHVRNDTLMDKPQRIPKQCRKQLKFELLQRVGPKFFFQLLSYVQKCHVSLPSSRHHLSYDDCLEHKRET